MANEKGLRKIAQATIKKTIKNNKKQDYGY